MSDALRGVVAMVDVRLKDAEASDSVRAILVSMGAQVRTTLAKDLTHLVWQNGKKANLGKALARENVAVVSSLWLDRCSQAGLRVDEKDFRITAIDEAAVPAKPQSQRYSREPKPLPPSAISESTSAELNELESVNTIETSLLNTSALSTTTLIDRVASPVNNSKEMSDDVALLSEPSSTFNLNSSPTLGPTRRGSNSKLALGGRKAPRAITPTLSVSSNGENAVALSTIETAHVRAATPFTISKDSDLDFLVDDDGTRQKTDASQPSQQLPQSTPDWLKNPPVIPTAVSGTSPAVSTYKRSRPRPRSSTASTSPATETTPATPGPSSKSAKVAIVIATEPAQVSYDLKPATLQSDQQIPEPNIDTEHDPSEATKRSRGKRKSQDSAIHTAVSASPTDTITFFKKAKSTGKVLIETNKAILKESTNSAKNLTTSQPPTANFGKKGCAVLTSMPAHLRDVCVSTLKHLGHFTITDKVDTNTTHIICGEARRTLAVMQGILQGCWVVSAEWLLRSLSAEKLLLEDEFELHEIFPGARTARATSRPTMSLFEPGFNRFFIGETKTPTDTVTHLARAAGAEVTDDPRRATLCIGNPVIGRGSRRTSVPIELHVNETWLFDSITAYKQLDLVSYVPAGNGQEGSKSPSF